MNMQVLLILKLMICALQGAIIIQVKGPAMTSQFTMVLQQLLYEINTRQDKVVSPWNVLNALSRE